MKEVDFNFEKNSVESITLDTLKATRNETNFGFKPFNNILHFDFIDAIFNKIQGADLKCELVDLYAGRGGSKTSPGVSFIGDVDNEENKKDINNWVFRRIMGKILIKKLSRPDMTMGVAFSYHQLGLEIAMGPDIEVCKNFSILGKESYIYTYGNDKLPNHERMIEVLGDWMADYEDKTVQQFQMVDTMRNKEATSYQVEQMIGDLTLQRVRHESKKLAHSQNFPMTQPQIGKFAENYAIKTEENEKISVYDVYNFGTQMYKPGDTDFPNVLSANYRFSNYLQSFFNLN